MKTFKTWVRFYCDVDFEVEAEDEMDAYKQIDEQARRYPVYAKDLFYEINMTDMEEDD